jgi:hypothetical protein
MVTPSTHPTTTLAKLQGLIAEYKKHGHGVAESCRLVAKLLREQIQPEPTWSWNYIHLLSHGKLPIPPNVKFAINQIVPGQNQPLPLKLQSVNVLAPEDLTDQPIVITQTPRICKYCRKPFLPASSGQKYCTKSCRLASRRK